MAEHLGAKEAGQWAEEFVHGTDEQARAALDYFRARCRNQMMLAALGVLGRDRESAEDAAQHAFEKALRERATVTPATFPHVRGWLCAVARNRAIDLVRSSARRQYDSLDQSEIGDAGRQLDHTFRVMAFKQAVNQALTQVSDRDRRIFVAVLQQFEQGCTTVEAACEQASQHLSLSRGRIKIVFLTVRKVVKASTSLAEWIPGGEIAVEMEELRPPVARP